MTPIVSNVLLRTQSDHRLAALVHAGHERAFEVLVERYRKPLYAQCRRILTAERAEDAVQQAFLSAWSALREGVEVRDMRAWLHRIARNAALNARRRAGYDYDELRESLVGSETAEADLERRAVMRRTLAGLAALPERQREALLRIAVEGRTHAEVARDLGVSDGAVRQLVHRARSTLRSVATAITPMPVATWMAGLGPEAAPAGQRIAELA
ncbi:MAG: sigma-70 family RNA polymerase sigma factor, partial [Actinomycetota bacterium]|nr:sigma-70 family RNA polymerase sigma factor [Actinomycetota bacterium]